MKLNRIWLSNIILLMDLNQLLDGIPNCKSLQKKISKIPSNQLDKLIKQYGSLGNTNSAELSTRDRLKEKIREKQIQRGGKAREQLRQAKLEEKKEQELAKITPSETEEESQKRNCLRLKKLQKKYKTISEEDYFKSLLMLHQVKTDDKLARDKNLIQQYQNKVDLYHHQHRNDEELQLRDEPDIDLTLDPEDSTVVKN